MRIAVLEDDPSQLQLFGHWLAVAGHDPQRFDYGDELVQAMSRESFDLLILDWNVPDLSGIEVLRRIRQNSKVPVIFCTARDGQDDVVTALREGADDYLHKPIRCMELLARIESATRRVARKHPKPEAFEVDRFHVNYASRTITRDGALLDLQAKDFDLAVLFLANLGRLLSHYRYARQSNPQQTWSCLRTRLGAQGSLCAWLSLRASEACGATFSIKRLGTTTPFIFSLAPYQEAVVSVRCDSQNGFCCSALERTSHAAVK